MINILECPCCGSKENSTKLTCRDHTVSHETFTIKQCSNCGFLFTSPRPENNHLAHYYQGENYISHNTHTRSLSGIAYRTARHFTLQWKLSIINRYHNPTEEKSILDYGCGTGNFLSHLTQHAWHGTGIEPSDHARRQVPPTIKNHVYKTLDEAPEQTYSTITLWHVLEHIPDLHATLHQLSIHLKPNGTLFLAVPNPNSYHARHYKQSWAAYDVPRHLWHFTPVTMAQILAQHNLKIIDKIPMRLDAYYISLLSEKYLGRNSISAAIHGAIEAFKSNQLAGGTDQYASLIYIARL